MAMTVKPLEGMDLVQVRLPVGLKRRLATFTQQCGRSMTQVVREALETYLGHEATEETGTGLCGIWQDDRTPEAIIQDIRAHRTALVKSRPRA